MKLIIDIPKAWGKCKIGFIKNCIRDGIELSSLTNGEVMQKAFPKAKILYIDEWEDYNNTHSLYKKAWVKVDFGYGEVLGFSLDWWNRKWGE